MAVDGVPLQLGFGDERCDDLGMRIEEDVRLAQANRLPFTVSAKKAEPSDDSVNVQCARDDHR